MRREELNEVEEKHFRTEDLWVFYWEEPAKISLALCGKIFLMVLITREFTLERSRTFIQRKSLTCFLCEELVFHGWDLKWHKRHSGVKNRFALSVGRLLRQILKRNGTREFTLEKNLTTVHSVTRFNRSGNLKAHERIHTGEKLHTCDQCGRSFTQAYGLKHLHSHSGEICYG